MTDKKFVLSIYSKAKVKKYGFGFYIYDSDSHRNLSGIYFRPKIAWKRARMGIDYAIIQKLES